MWTFGKKLALGFGLTCILLFAVGAISYVSLDSLIGTSRQVARTHEVLQGLSEVFALVRDAETGQRGFVITGEEAFLEPYKKAVDALPPKRAALRELARGSRDMNSDLDVADKNIDEKLAELALTIDLMRTEGFVETQKRVKEGRGKRAMDDVRTAFGRIEQRERDTLGRREAQAGRTADAAIATIIGGTILSLLLALAAGIVLTRSLTTQIGSAVAHVQSSSAELQAAANQQVSGAREQATALTEITTTISELLATSRQIAGSSQQVAQIAADTASAARSGDQTVQRTQESVAAIRRQVDAIVVHMVELGKKSQQIGGVLDIINELSEQTNILAINATIEAAGAGEIGKRFAVVADEIRKLADRVGGSTKEIRLLVDDIRSAVNTTVMATEGGSKAVDTGTRQFGEVESSFRQIATLVGTTTAAAKEIELSTKQQTTAVEQVTIAVTNVSQAARETEASSSQTLQTASQLQTLSRELIRLIQPRARA
jgi:methyl-accepting chemotaxis protein